jgi:hypothetical protein
VRLPAPTGTVDVGGSATMDAGNDCTIVRKPLGQVGTTGGSTLYGEELYLRVWGYHMCSARLELHGGSMTWQPDPQSALTFNRRAVKLGFHPYDAEHSDIVTHGLKTEGCVP